MDDHSISALIACSGLDISCEHEKELAGYASQLFSVLRPGLYKPGSTLKDSDQAPEAIQRIFARTQTIDELNLADVPPTHHFTAPFNIDSPDAARKAQGQPGLPQCPDRAGENNIPQGKGQSLENSYQNQINRLQKPGRNKSNPVDLSAYGIAELGRLMARRKLSAVELTQACLDRIQQQDHQFNTFINVFKDQALAQAEKAQADMDKNRAKSPLHGIPFGLKDLYMVKDHPFTLGSRLFDGRIAHQDSTVARRLISAGAILLGKQNMNPLAYGPYAQEPGYDYGPVFNPHDPARISGGSSGGSGAAVAAGFCPFSIGSDTGGSVRIPACWCGVPALKPTYGRISRFGMHPLSWSLDHPGPMARKVEDLALIMNILSGHDPKDPSSARVPVPDFAAGLQRDIKGLKIGLPREYWDLPMDPKVRGQAEMSLELLEDMGAQTIELSWPMMAYAENISNIILLAEASSCNEALVKSRGEQLLPGLRLRLEAGLLLPAADYLRALKARTLLMNQTNKLFEQVDLIAGPTMPVTATRPGQASVDAGDRSIGVVRAMTQFNEVFNLTGHPALTLPCTASTQELPMGFQLISRHFDEALVLAVGHRLESALALCNGKSETNKPNYR